MQLNYHLYFNSTGYSIAAQEYILAMLRVDPSFDIKVNYLNIHEDAGISKNRRQIFAAMKKKPINYPCVNLYQSIPHLYRRPKRIERHIGFCVFETINPPSQWVKFMNEMDEIITASVFNQRVFEQAGCTLPITAIPHCFDSEMFNKDVSSKGRYDMTTFFAMGTWKDRKNWDVLIKAFYDAFETKDKVCLLIKTDNPQSLESEVLRIKKNGDWRAKKTAPIFAEKKTHCDFEDIPATMKRGDIYISTSLGEGFGLPALHAMALGMPVIVPRFGGTLEYALPDLCTHINPKSYKTYKTMDGIPQFGNCIWPVLRIEDVRDAMREVYENYPADKTEAAYRYAHTNFTYETIGPRFIEAVAI